MHWFVQDLRQYHELSDDVGCRKVYDKNFADFPVKDFEPVDVVFRLAEQAGAALICSAGFDGLV